MTLELEERLRVLGEHLDGERFAVGTPLVDLGGALRRRRWAGAAAVIVVMVGAGVSLAVRRPASNAPVATDPPTSGAASSIDPSTSVSGSQPTPSLPPVSETLRWEQMESPDFSLDGYSFVATLDDGRALLWNGTEATELVPVARDVRLAFYDPTNDTWQRSAAFPLSQAFGNDARLVGDSVLIHQYDEPQGSRRFVRYRVSDDTWEVSAELPAQSIVLGWTATDETIGAWVGSIGSESRRILRWTSGAAWAEGAAAPFSSRVEEGIDADGALLAVYGGISQQRANGVPFPQTDDAAPTSPSIVIDSDDRFAALDGGLYDLSRDEWTAIPASPLRGVANPQVIVDGTTVAVAGGIPATSAAGPLQQMATYRVGEGWRVAEFDETWRGRDVRPSADGRRFIADSAGLLLASDTEFSRWNTFAGSEEAWPPTVIGEALFIQPFPSQGGVQFVVFDDEQSRLAPPTPWLTTPATGYESTFVPLGDGVLVIDGGSPAWRLIIDG
jgi:hypothetical protein